MSRVGQYFTVAGRGETTYNFNLNSDFPQSNPRNRNAMNMIRNTPTAGRITPYNMVMKTANHSSCALSKVCASLLHSPRAIS